MRANSPVSVARSRWFCTSCLTLPAVASLMAASVAAAQALPSGGSVAAGSATIQSSAAAVAVKQGSNRAVINWNSFNVGAGKVVTFQQPGAGAAILNRVTGPGGASIAGSLSSNGQVFLIDRNGVVITPTGTVNTAGFVASSLDIANADFMSGQYNFSGAGAGAVVNQGAIVAAPGSAVALLGSSVSNEGLISAPLGRVALGSGQSATLDFSGNGFLQVAIPTDLIGDANQALISNSGRIQADGGRVVIQAAAARDAVRQTVNMSGVITARGASGQDGAVILDGGDGGDATVSGTIDVSGPLNGGTIDLTAGHSLSLLGASLTATGGDTGGLIRVGGMFQGGQSTTVTVASLVQKFTGRFGDVGALAASDTTLVDAATTIDVSGAKTGGTVVIWSALQTDQEGSILAGGATGGAIEVSSHELLLTDLSKINPGPGGTLLLDPANISTVTADNFVANGGTLTETTYTGPIGYDATSDTSYIDIAKLTTLIDNGTDIVLKASNDITFGGLNVGFAASPGNIFLSAGRSVFLGDITLGHSNLTVVANDTAANGVVSAQRGPGPGEIDSFNAASFNGATLFGGAGSGGGGGDISLTVGTGLVAGSAGNLRLTGIQTNGSGDITLSTSGQSGVFIQFFPIQDQIGHATDQVGITAAGAVTLTGNILVDTIGGLAVTGQSVSWTDETTSILSGFSGGPVSFTTVSGIGQPGVVTRYGILFNAGGDGPPTDQTRISLGAGGVGPQYSITYGDADPTFIQAHITAGALLSPGGVPDTLAGVLAELSNLTTTGPALFAGVGDQAVTTSATPNLSSTISGYFFNLTTAVDTLHINPKVLTPTLTPGAYTYGSPTAVIALTGVVNNDSVQPLASLDGASAPLSPILAGYGFAVGVAAGGHDYTVTGLGGAGAGNYQLAGGIFSSTLSIAQKPLTYTVSDVSRTYGDAPGTTPVSFTGVINGDVVTPVAQTAATGGAIIVPAFNTPAGAYVTSVTGLGGTGAANYSLASVGNINGALTIAQKPLTYTAVAANSTYGTLATVATPTLNGVLAGDTVTAVTLLNGAPAALSAQTSAGVYAISAGITGVSSSNYVVAVSGDTTASLTIAQKTVTVTLSSASEVYGTPTNVLTLSGVIGSDDVVPVVTDAFAGATSGVALSMNAGGFDIPGKELVGAHTLTFAGFQGAAAGDYTATIVGASTLTVTPRPLHYTIDTSTVAFGVTGAAPIVTLDTVFGDVIAGSIVATIQGTSTVVPFSNSSMPGGAYTLSLAGPLTGFFASDYTLSPTGDTAGLRTVTPRSVTYTVGAFASTYGSVFNLPGANFSFINPGDSVSGVITVVQGGSTVTLGARSPVGSYTLEVTGLTGAQAGNYVIANSGNSNGSLTISPLAIHYNLSAATSTYGTLATPAAPIFLGLVPGDVVSGTIATLLFNNIPGGPTEPLDARMDAGTYTLTVSALTGPDSGNYALTTSGNGLANLVINPKPVTYAFASVNAVYGSVVTPGAITLTGVLPNDVVLTSSAFGFGGAIEPVGSYAETGVSIFGPASGNYVLDTADSTNGVYIIAPRPLNAFVSLNGISSVVYGSLTPANAASMIGVNLSGALPQDRLTATLAPSASTPLVASDAGLLKAGSYTYAVTGLTGPGASNYTLASSTSATFQVAPEALTGTLANTSTTYGSAPVFPTPVISGVFSGDLVAVGRFAVSDLHGTPVVLTTNTAAGTYIFQVQILSGADASDYSSSISSAFLTINPKALTYQAVQAASTYGTLAVLTPAILTGTVGADDVSGVYGLSSALTSRTNAGSYSLTVTSLTGAASSDYTLATAGNTTSTLTISPKTLSYTITTPTQTGVYGATFASPVQLQGVLAGDDVSLPTPLAQTGSSLNFVSQILNVATYQVTLQQQSNTLYALGGASAGNYALPNDHAASVGAIVVTPRTLSYGLSVGASTSVYGSPTTVQVSLSDVAPGTSLSYTVVATAGGASTDVGAVTTLPSNLGAGSYTLSVRPTGADATNYVLATAADTNASLTISPKPITAVANAETGVYGSALGDVVELPGVLTGDTVMPIVTLSGAASKATLTLLGATAVGFSLPANQSAGVYTLAVSSLGGAMAGDYMLTNGGVGAPETITQKPLTFSIAPVTGQYGGLTIPSCTPGCEMFTSPNFGPGAITLSGIVFGDNVTGNLQLTDNVSVFNYTQTTVPGTYFQIVTGLSGSGAANYKIASSGNTAGVMTIIPGYVQASVSSGSLVYDGSPDGLTVGTPGIATVERSITGPVFNGGPLTGFVAGDNVSVVVAIFINGAVYTGGQPMPLGDYELRPVGLTGPDASKYQLVPQAFSSPSEGNVPGSTSGDYGVYDSSVLNFSFLSSQPNQAYVPPSTFAGTTVTAAASTTAGSNATGTTGVLSYTGTAQAGASATGGVTVGAATLSGTVGASTSTLAQFGVTGVYVTGTAQVGDSVKLQVGPAYVSVGESASATGAFTIDPLSSDPSINIDGTVKLSTTATVGAGGSLGSGVTGNTSVQGQVFTEARSNTDLTVDNGSLTVGESEFVGVGASTGVTGGISYGGVTGSATVTVFSPGSLYIGARSVSGVTDGTFTLGFTIGISIGIGGLELKPSISFPVAPIVTAANDVGSVLTYVFTGTDNTCYSACQQAQAAAAAQVTLENKLKATEAMIKKGPSLALVSYLAANPDVVAAATADENTPSSPDWIGSYAVVAAYQKYGSIPSQLNSVVSQEQALVSRLKANPSSLTSADLQLAASLRAQEASLISTAAQIGGKLSVVDGSLSLVPGG